jgi:uncharacterized membrane protein YgcG
LSGETGDILVRIFRSGLAAIALLSAGTALAGPPAWSFSESSGQVIVVSPGTSRIAHRNDVLKIGDTVSTGPNGRAIVVRGEEYLVVAPNSRFRIADPSRSGEMTQIVEQAGNIVYRIKKKATPHFGVQTPYLAAVVKGTTFSVTVNERGATVQVLEGRVEVATRDGGATYMVLPGDIGSVSATATQTLDVRGRETRQLVSPLPPEAMPPAEDDKTAATPALWEDAPKASLDGVIVTAVGEGPVRLDSLSDGLVRGDSSLGAVVATAAVAARAPAPVPITGTGPETDHPAPVSTDNEVVIVALPPTPADLPPPPVQAPPVGANGPAPVVTQVVVAPTFPVAGNSGNSGNNGNSGSSNNGNGNGNNGNGNGNGGPNGRWGGPGRPGRN